MDIAAQGLIFDASDAPALRRSCAFTSLCVLADGSFLVGFRLAAGRDIPGGRLRLMGSSDGTHWRTVHDGLVFDIEGITGDTYAGYLWEQTPGELLGAFVWVDRSDPCRSFVNPETTGILPTRNLLARSEDGGASWKHCREVDLGPECGCTVTGPVLEHEPGLLGLPYETWKAWDDISSGQHTASLRWSRDDGDTWDERDIVAADPLERILYWDQRIAIHPDNREMVAMFWTHDRVQGLDLQNHMSRSDGPRGRWSQPEPVGWSGQHCQPLALGEDRLAAVSVRRGAPGAIEIRVSEDFGRTWSHDVVEVFRVPDAGAAGPSSFEAFWQSMMTWEFGHPRAVLTPEGDILTVWYAAAPGGGTNVHWARVRV